MLNYIYSSLNWPLHFYWKRNQDSILLKFSFLNVILINVYVTLKKRKLMDGQIKLRNVNSAICSALYLFYFYLMLTIIQCQYLRSSHHLSVNSKQRNENSILNNKEKNHIPN